MVLVNAASGLESADEAGFRKLLALAPGIAWVAYDASIRRGRGVLLGVSSLALVTLVVWFVISDVVFLHPSGEAIIRAMAKALVW